MQIYHSSRKIIKIFTTLFLLSFLLSSLQSQEKINAKDPLNTNQDSKEKKEIEKAKVFSLWETAYFASVSIFLLSNYNPYLVAAENAKQMRNEKIYLLLLGNSTNNLDDALWGISPVVYYSDANIGYLRYKARESLQYSSICAFFALLGFFWEKEVVVQPLPPPPSASNYKFQPFLKMYGKDFEIGLAYRF